MNSDKILLMFLFWSTLGVLFCWMFSSMRRQEKAMQNIYRQLKEEHTQNAEHYLHLVCQLEGQKQTEAANESRLHRNMAAYWAQREKAWKNGEE